MNTLQSILARSNYSFVRAITASRELYESACTGNLVIIDWLNSRILPITA